MSDDATNIDKTVKALLDGLGYTSLYPPQEMAVSSGILEGRNMLVTTPTASGKTLIAMMAIAKTLERGQKA
ncbi:MAG TPA: DEAD/DEAH box helicase, partial [Nitrososphaera sp.]|nr:DEAD/DEAH box helicase [Nitrososphaera sp.]